MKKIHRAWFVFLACCLLYGCSTGMVINCRGVYFAAASAELGVSPGTYGTCQLVYGLTASLALPFVIRLLLRLPFKPALTGIVSLFSLANILLGFSRSMTTTYLIFALQGIAGGCLTYYILAYLIKNWFVKAQGTVLSLATVFSGLIATVMNPLTQTLIDTIGWRMTYVSVGAAVFALTVPAIVLFLDRQPSDVGLAAYGAEIRTEARVEEPPQSSAGTPALVRILFLAAVFGITAGYSQQIPTFGRSIGHPASAAAIAVSCSMIGNVGGKLLLGILNDRKGAYFTGFFSMGTVLLSYLLLAVSASVPSLLFLSAFLNGISMSQLAVELPLFAGKVFLSSAEYAKKYVYISCITCFTGAFTSALVGKLYDLFGSYVPSFVLAAVCSLIGILLMNAMLRSSRKTQAL